MFILLNLLIGVALFGLMVAVQEAGRRLGIRHSGRDPKEEKSSSPAEGAVYGLLGLLIAFTFSGAAGRYDERRNFVGQEANAIGTAWLRIDLLPRETQPAIRDLFRQYVDARLAEYRVSRGDAEAAARAVTLQSQIWSASVEAATRAGTVPPFTVALPALNDMFDIAATRAEARRLHPPLAVFLMLGLVALLASLFAGYGVAGRPRARLYTIGFAAVITLALFVIIDFEFPRFGLIRLDSADTVIVDVRRSMN